VLSLGTLCISKTRAPCTQSVKINLHQLCYIKPVGAIKLSVQLLRVTASMNDASYGDLPSWHAIMRPYWQKGTRRRLKLALRRLQLASTMHDRRVANASPVENLFKKRLTFKQ